MRVLVILNGKSSGDGSLRRGVAELREGGFEVDVRVTWEAGDAARFAQVTNESYDVVVGAGGDGTVNEIVNGLMRVPVDQRCALGLVGLGTANDFATSLGIPAESGAALKLATSGRTHRVDVARANDRFFLNVATGGFGAEVTVATPPEMKRLLGGAAYTVMGAILARKFEAYEGRIVMPEAEIAGAGLALIVGNGRQTGGGKQFTPKALLDDGLLDVVTVGDINTSNLRQAAAELKDPSADGELITYHQTPWAEVRTDRPLPVNLDGEPIRAEAVRFEVHPRQIGIVLPDECALVSAN